MEPVAGYLLRLLLSLAVIVLVVEGIAVVVAFAGRRFNHHASTSEAGGLDPPGLPA